MSPSYPIGLRLHGRRVLIAGGGNLARQKLLGLAASGAQVTVVAPRLLPELDAGFPPERLRLRQRAFRVSDLRGVSLVFGATDEPAVNRRVVEAARARSILANAVDDPEFCDFFTPAVLERHGVQFTVATSGAFPGLTRALREVLEAWLPEAHGDVLQRLYDLRRALLNSPLDATARGQVLRELARRLSEDYLTPAGAEPRVAPSPSVSSSQTVLPETPSPELPLHAAQERA
jgi:precorrin-2 dehydrogenase/sirohydrochlorin ferrochelatase